MSTLFFIFLIVIYNRSFSYSNIKPIILERVKKARFYITLKIHGTILLLFPQISDKIYILIFRPALLLPCSCRFPTRRKLRTEIRGIILLSILGMVSVVVYIIYYSDTVCIYIYKNAKRKAQRKFFRYAFHKTNRRFYIVLCGFNDFPSTAHSVFKSLFYSLLGCKFGNISIICKKDIAMLSCCN